MKLLVKPYPLFQAHKMRVDNTIDKAISTGAFKNMSDRRFNALNKAHKAYSQMETPNSMVHDLHVSALTHLATGH